MMATRNETPTVLGETAPSRFFQSAGRLRKKAFQNITCRHKSKFSIKTRETGKDQTANEGISRMDNIIQKKSTAGRPRTRSDQEAAEGGGSSTRLSMLSTTSTQAARTPKRNKIQ
jgi:hypothetical protein